MFSFKEVFFFCNCPHSSRDSVSPVCRIFINVTTKNIFDKIKLLICLTCNLNQEFIFSLFLYLLMDQLDWVQQGSSLGAASPLLASCSQTPGFPPRIFLVYHQTKWQFYSFQEMGVWQNITCEGFSASLKMYN